MHRSALRTIAVIGAGSAGQEFAARCLAVGRDVCLEDVMPATLRNARYALATAAVAGAGSLTTMQTVEDAVRTADLAIDFVPDELESKLEIFSMVDRMAPPRTVLCTPSDALSIADLASCTYRPERCFALRGLSAALAPEPVPREPGRTAQGASTPVLLTYPRAADLEARIALQEFLTDLGLMVEAHPDTAESQLTHRR